MKSELEMAREVVNEIPYDVRVNLITSNSNDLIKYHNNLGRDIRNYFKLWERKWEPFYAGDTDISHMHPDSISSRIILLVWSILQENYVSN